MDGKTSKTAEKIKEKKEAEDAKLKKERAKV